MEAVDFDLKWIRKCCGLRQFNYLSLSRGAVPGVIAGASIYDDFRASLVLAKKKIQTSNEYPLLGLLY